ncbi:MAG: acetyl-CoA carboxylase biotin carboxyl carrier protein subunit [Gemmatimonadota bacterium]|nr:MAG: acetyl-CoA carboxylase biotin carboxyl carrier protein subunit [Gemmatimonadota bacterium]
MTMSKPTDRYYVQFRGEERIVDLTEQEDGTLRVELDGEPVSADLTRLQSSLHSLLVDGHSREMVVERDGDRVIVLLDGERIETTVYDEVTRALAKIGGAGSTGAPEVCAPMPGVVVDILVKPGDPVATGQAVIVVEAMKMQNELAAESDGVVASIEVAVGDTVGGGDVLIKLGAIES